MGTTSTQLMRPRRHAASACLVALAPLLSGCGVGERVAQCNQLARALNAGLTPVRGYIAANPGVSTHQASPEQYQEVKALYTSLANALDAAELSDEKLTELKQGFSQMFSQAAAACGDLSSARKDADAAAKSRAQRELSRLARREESLHGRTLSYCTSP